MAARKTAAQKAAEAAEREAETTYPVTEAEPDTAPESDEEPDTAGDNLTDVTDDKGRRLTVQQLKNKLRNEAERETLDNHRPEVIARTAEKYKAHNLEYVRRLTDEEKAQKQIEELYEKFPQLRPATPAPVEAVPGGALATFRAGDYEYREEPGYLEDPEVEAREGE